MTQGEYDVHPHTLSTRDEISTSPSLSLKYLIFLLGRDFVVEIPTVDQQIMQYNKTQYKIYFYNTLRKLNRIEQDQENTYN